MLYSLDAKAPWKLEVISCGFRPLSLDFVTTSFYHTWIFGARFGKTRRTGGLSRAKIFNDALGCMETLCLHVWLVNENTEKSETWTKS
jgi:hypothetical protein